MDQDQLRLLLEEVRTGAVNVDAAVERMRHLPFEDLGWAKLDHHRALRHGLTEVIFGKGKTPEQIAIIAARLLEKSPNLLITRADESIAARLKKSFPDAEYFALSGAVRVWRDRAIRGKGKLAVVCAGTSDIPVAEEAQVTAEVMGNEVEAIYDVGVAGKIFGGAVNHQVGPQGAEGLDLRGGFIAGSGDREVDALAQLGGGVCQQAQAFGICFRHVEEA